MSTKVHLAVDGQGRPLLITLSPGQRHECTRFEPLVEGLPWHPDRIVGDKGYSYTTVRAWLDARAIATRFDKRGRNYRTQLVLAAIMIWLPTLPSHPSDTP